MNKKINIGYFGTRGLGNYGGFETIALNLSEKIDKKFFNLFISNEVDEIEGNEKFVESNIKKSVFLINIKKSKLKKFNYIDNIINEGKIINTCFKNNPWNIKVIFQCGSTPGLVISKKKSKRNPLLLFNPDGIEWKRKKFKWYGRLILYLSTKRGIKLADAVTVDSYEIYKDLKKWLKNKIVYYLPSGAEILEEKDVNSNYLKEFNLKPYEYYIIVGRSVPENHIYEIIKYFLHINTNKKLLIVTNPGKDIYSKNVLELIDKNRDKIIFKGAIYDQKKLKSLRYFSYAYLHGHSVGGTNPSLLESMGAGNPPVCYDVPYNKEVARDSAFYFKDFRTFKKAILKLDKDKELRNLMSKNAREIIRKDYLWDFIVELHEVVAMHSLTFYNIIDKKEYQDWLKTKEYYTKFLERKFDTFERGIIR